MASHKAASDAGEVERLVILVVVIFGTEVFIPVARHILLEESYKVFTYSVYKYSFQTTKRLYQYNFLEYFNSLVCTT